MDAARRSPSKSGTRIDPGGDRDHELGLIAVTEEMKSILMRTAYNMIIYEALDFTVGVFDAEGDTLSIGLGLPMFIRGISETVKAKLRHLGGRISRRATSSSPTTPTSTGSPP